MLETILDLEKKLIRVETWLLVACVVIMLALAGYNVAYRNLLVPWQTQLLTSGPPVTSEADSPASDQAELPEQSGESDAAADEADDDFAGGFGAPADDEADETADEEGGFEGGFGGGEAPAEEPAQDEEGGFEGGFGAPAEEDEPETRADVGADEQEDFEGGFGASEDDDGEIGGGFGAADDVEDEPAAAPDEDEGAAEQVDAAAIAEEAVDDETEPTGGPPPKGSFADTMVGVIDAMKLAWIDVLLRQLVIITGFLGAMLAARRRNHITIDAVGKLLEGRPRHIVDAITSFVSVVVCAVLAVAGWDLVKIGLEFPSELLPWAEEWTFQLAFPLGFGLLSLHFAIRVYESAVLAMEDEPLDDGEGGDAEDAATAEAAAGGAV
jgi:TRAP-type C4-dicarboxylate transport system permease small subunit